jgi:hypothetical protein
MRMTPPASSGVGVSRSWVSPQCCRRPEDVVIQKLRWAIKAGRSKDRGDARAVLAVQSDAPDMTYVRTWCDQHGTRALLEELLNAISDSTSPA